MLLLRMVLSLPQLLRNGRQRRRWSLLVLATAIVRLIIWLMRRQPKARLIYTLLMLRWRVRYFILLVVLLTLIVRPIVGLLLNLLLVWLRRRQGGILLRHLLDIVWLGRWLRQWPVGRITAICIVGELRR